MLPDPCSDPDGEVLTAPAVIESPNYPQRYPSFADCQWRVISDQPVSYSSYNITDIGKIEKERDDLMPDKVKWKQMVTCFYKPYTTKHDYCRFKYFITRLNYNYWECVFKHQHLKIFCLKVNKYEEFSPT